MSENWMPVVGYEALYEVSDLGAVRSLDRLVSPRPGARPGLRKGRLLKSWLDPDGYLTVKLYAAGPGRSPRTLGVHRLVLEAFVGPCPPSMEACHNDGVRSNGRLDNLRWDTRSANHIDKVKHGNHHLANRSSCSRGHLFDAANTRQGPGGSRICRKCCALRAYDRRRAMGIPTRKPRPDLVDVIFGEAS